METNSDSILDALDGKFTPEPETSCYICRDSSFARIGMPTCGKCEQCGGHVGADTDRCSACNHQHEGAGGIKPDKEPVHREPPDPKYAEWISTYKDRHKEKPLGVRGLCKEATDEMKAVFPELEQVRGHVLDIFMSEKEQPHWWLEDLHGNIVDPTASQFVMPNYEPWDEQASEPTGICPNCGEYCFNGAYCCTEACHSSYVAYCNNPY